MSYPQVCLLPAALYEITADASRTGRLTLGDRYGLMAALLSDGLSEEEHQTFDRLLYALRRGKIT